MTSPPFSFMPAPHSAIFSTPAPIAWGIRAGNSISLLIIVAASFPAAPKILGSPVISPFTMAAIIRGAASISSGIAFIMPSASPITSCKAASISIGTLFISVSTMASIASVTLGISSGSASPSPFASPAIICAAPSASDGISSAMPLINVVTISVALSVSVGIASTTPSTSPAIIPTPVCTIAGALSTMPSASPLTSSTAKSAICGSISESPLIMFPNASPKLRASFPMSPSASAAPCANSFANWLKIGSACSPIGMMKLVCKILPAPCIASPKVSYFTAFICPIASTDLLISPSTPISAVQASAPMSSHMVPINPTPALYCRLLSSQSLSALLTWLMASFALSPPFWNFPTTSSALSPRLTRKSFAVPSFMRMLNSLNASPILSMLQTPVAAPFAIELNISSAPSPACEYWLLYSLITSSKSPFLFSPFCAPCAIRLYASSEDKPNFCISCVAALVLSATSKSNVSRNANALVVIFSSSPAPKSPACCRTSAIAAAMSSKPSPKFAL